jgi:hypothetical protein
MGRTVGNKVTVVQPTNTEWYGSPDLILRQLVTSTKITHCGKVTYHFKNISNLGQYVIAKVM